MISLERTLKPIFNSFAKIRGVSIRSLQLIYRGRTMFLGDMKNKTPKQLGMTHDHDKDEATTVVIESKEMHVGNAAVIQQQKTQGGAPKNGGKVVGRNKHQKQHYVPYYLSIVFILSLKYAFGIISMFFTLVRCSIILSRLFLTYLHPCFLPYVRIH